MLDDPDVDLFVELAKSRCFEAFWKAVDTLLERLLMSGDMDQMWHICLLKENQIVLLYSHDFMKFNLQPHCHT